jgi:hypothetical protein
VGGGDVGTVYLCRLRAPPAPVCCLYAMKVVDRRVVATKKKLELQVCCLYAKRNLTKKRTTFPLN